MSGHVSIVTSFVIESGQTESNTLTATDFRDADSLSIFAPTTLPETVTLQAAPNSSPVAADWVDVDRGGDVTMVAGAVKTIELPAFMALRLRAGVAVAATRTFPVNKGFAT